MKLDKKTKKAATDYVYALAAVVVAEAVSLATHMWPGWAMIIGAIAAPAIKWADKYNKDYGRGSKKK